MHRKYFRELGKTYPETSGNVQNCNTFEELASYLEHTCTYREHAFKLGNTLWDIGKLVKQFEIIACNYHPIIDKRLNTEGMR